MNENSDFDLEQLGPGAFLKHAREAKSMSLQDVAKALHYKKDLIEKIEADDYSDARSETFARGYLKSYAKLLDIPHDDVYARFERFHLAKNIQSHKPEFINEKEYGVTNRSFRWITYLIVIILIVLMSLWWRSHNAENKSINTRIPVGTHMDLLKQKPEPKDLTISPLSGNAKTPVTSTNDQAS